MMDIEEIDIADEEYQAQDFIYNAATLEAFKTMKNYDDIIEDSSDLWKLK